MIWHADYIELFGEKLLLHERMINDALKVSEFLQNTPEKMDQKLNAFIQVQLLQDALKLNLEKCYLHIFGIKILVRPFRYKKLKEYFSTEYLFQNLGISTLHKLVDKVLYEFEGNKRNEMQTKKETMSNENMISLVSHFSGISWDEARELPVGEFTSRLEQAVNLAGLISGAGYKPLTRKDKQTNLDKEYQMIFGVT